MKYAALFALLMSGTLLSGGGLSQAAPISSAFTYQGRLTDGGGPADGVYDFEFRLFDSVDGGNQVGVTRRIDEVEVAGGYFTTKLDFGNAAFAGDSRWLDVGVRSGALEDPNDFTVLTPRQALTAAPYALYAANSPDSDTLAGLSCGNGQIPKWNGTSWVCGEDIVGGGGPGSEPTAVSGTWKAVRLIGDQRLFRDIVQKVAEGHSVDGSLVYLDLFGREARRINFFGIIPVSFDTLRIDASGGGSLVEETLEFTVSRVELRIDVEANPRMFLYSGHFLFELDGPIGGVRAVTPGPILFDYPDPQPISFIPDTPRYTGGGGLPDEYLRVYGFNFEIVDGLSRADLRWSKISGGAMQFLDPQFVKPGIVFSDVELYGPMVNWNERKDMVDWLNEWLRGERTPGDSKLEILDAAGISVEEVQYLGVAPVSYHPPAVDGRGDDALYEKLTFKAHIIEAR